VTWNFRRINLTDDVQAAKMIDARTGVKQRVRVKPKACERTRSLAREKQVRRREKRAHPLSTLRTLQVDPFNRNALVQFAIPAGRVGLERIACWRLHFDDRRARIT
jgi:hypothetical protein